MHKPILTVAACLLAGLLAVFDFAPLVLLSPIPRTALYTGGGLILLLMVGIVVAYRAKTLAGGKRPTLFRALLIGFGINVLTAALVRTLPPPFLNSLYSGTIASLFGLDGESAYVAAEYEVWCEIWLALVVATCAIAWGCRRHAVRRRIG